MRTRAVAAGEGWKLDGAKAVVEHGAQAGFFVVSARLAGEDDAADGLALFVVPRETPGLALRDYARIDGGRAAELRLDGVQLAASARLAGERAPSCSSASPATACWPWPPRRSARWRW